MIEKLENETDDTSIVPLHGLGIGNSYIGSNMFYGALPIHFEFARKLRDNSTEAENFLWEHLASINIDGIRFKRQHPILYFSLISIAIK